MRRALGVALVSTIVGAAFSWGCRVGAKDPAAVTGPLVGVTRVERKDLGRELTMSSELVPFEEIDVYAKQSGYVRQLRVDYGSRVKAGELLAVLEIPELEVQLREDAAAAQSARDQVVHSEHELGRVEAQHTVLHLQFQRLDGVGRSRPGLIAQQELDDSQGKDLAAEAQVEAARSALQAAQAQLIAANARKERGQVLFDYSRITAPFAGVVTQRYANLGALLQAGTASSTQAMPLVRLSRDDLFRLVIPVPESYVRYIHVGDPVNVAVTSLNRTLPGKVARFSVDVKEDTRTMHTEVDVPNPDRLLIPGLYAEATLTLEKHDKALAIPLQGLSHQHGQPTVFAVSADNKVEERKVVLGVQTPSDVEIVEGLKEGDLVIISDRSSLKPGQVVKPQPMEVLRYGGNQAAD